MAQYIDKKNDIKNEAIKEANKIIELSQKDHFKHLNKINRYNLEGYRKMNSKINRNTVLLIMSQIVVIFLLIKLIGIQ